MELINEYIISLVTTIIFITAVEMISPDNSIKKYIKFVLGIILVAVLITPIINIFTIGEVEIQKQIEYFTNKTISEMDNTSYEEQVQRRDKAFKDNLNKNTNELLKEEFSDLSFETNVDCNLNYRNMSYTINEIEVGVAYEGIKTIKEINIGNAKSVNTENEIKNEAEIKEYLSELFKISKEKINVHVLDRRD